MLRFMTGGVRSGKSTLAENIMRKTPGKTVYIATAVPFDEGMKDRIKRHQEQRPKEWATIERYKDYKALLENPDFTEADNVLYDCLTVMITNQMMDSGLDFDTCSVEEVHALEERIKEDLKDLLSALAGKNAIIVSNELGSGIVPSFMMGNYFRDIVGRANQYLASKADEVYFTVSGIGLKIKPELASIGSVHALV